MSFRTSAVGFAALLLLSAARADASAVFTVDFGENAGSLSTWTPANLGEVSNPDGTTTFTGSSPFGGGNFDASWDVTTDADPFVDGVFAITNNTLLTQIFVVSFSSTVLPPLPTATSGASVAGTLTVDNNGVGTGTLGHNGTDPFFTSIVDGSDFLTLLDPDSSVSASFGSATTATDFFGQPGLTEPVPGGVLTDIGIRLSFTLTAGDSASFTSRFEVVPEPTTGALIGIGLLALAIRRPRAS